MSIAVNGPLIVDDVQLVLRAALDGVGLAYLSEHDIAFHPAAERLIPVLQDWCRPYPGFFLYYPGRRQRTAAPAALAAVPRT